MLFSSVSGAIGNLGQANYAAANGFMDQFAAQRATQVAKGERYGVSLSVNWPLWEAGGMGLDAMSRQLLQQTTGMIPMSTATGVRVLHQLIGLLQQRPDIAQAVVMEGYQKQLDDFFKQTFQQQQVIHTPAKPAQNTNSSTAISTAASAASAASSKATLSKAALKQRISADLQQFLNHTIANKPEGVN